jgi:hypothetical protein
MYGLINNGIKDLIIKLSNDEKWQQVRTEAKVELNDFVAMQAYPEDITYNLVAAASKILGLSQGQVLEAFGRHWVIFAAAEGYGDIMNLFGKDYLSCLKNLNSMHAHLGAAMVGIRPPRFVVSAQKDGSSRVDYYSSRKGLAPMVKGLLEGLAMRYSEKVTVEFKERAANESFDSFTVKKVA